MSKLVWSPLTNTLCVIASTRFTGNGDSARENQRGGEGHQEHRRRRRRGGGGELERLAFDLLEDLLLGDEGLLQGLPDLPLPEGDQLVEGDDVRRRAQVQDLVQGARVVHRPDCVLRDVLLEHKDGCGKEGGQS